jgi:hypothetical protein
MDGSVICGAVEQFVAAAMPFHRPMQEYIVFVRLTRQAIPGIRVAACTPFRMNGEFRHDFRERLWSVQLVPP